MKVLVVDDDPVILALTEAVLKGLSHEVITRDRALGTNVAVIEAGRVLLPESAPWLDDFLNEILAFPNGRFDDQVDSLSQFLTWVRESRDWFGIAGC